MERLCSTENSCKGLDRNPNNVVVRLLRGQGFPASLGMKPELARFRIPGFETVLHDPGPDSTRSSEFRDLLQEIVPASKEERKLGRELVYLEPSFKGHLNVFDRVCETESQFLNRVCARLADMIAADTYRVPAGHFVRAVFSEVDALEETPHVLDATDCDSNSPNFSSSP